MSKSFDIKATGHTTRPPVETLTITLTGEHAYALKHVLDWVYEYSGNYRTTIGARRGFVGSLAREMAEAVVEAGLSWPR